MPTEYYIKPDLEWEEVKMSKPNPGSDEAIDQGCICPVLDNNHGAGISAEDGTLFWYVENCPVHKDN